ncbi:MULTISPECIES: extracellular solute-binding protein [unclassified Microbacterium]|uniref:ABC transporter substrate-binding protein n=1 Tax=unclassified Microbacterium TaxID=2609290 RepID=UPI00214D107B|nr:MULTISPECIES: extracellular solute-binding protein [unclassified Microbacterium]MCR2783399.1 extracellular solute-binding protein [Microbacterium sp. zg.B96]WIM15731.1 extracellular solute-binding protein [Microbacterium sp. zg-B96]
MGNAQPRRLALGAVGVVGALALAGCSGGGDAADGGELSIYIDSNPSSIALWDGLVAGYAEVNPDVTIEVETHPAGGEGDNLIKTRLSTGDMNDMFWYNSGSLLMALGPDKQLVSLSDEEWAADLDDNFVQAVSTEEGLYGVPVGASFAGAMVYNKDIYAELGLEVPTTWDEFMANAEAVTDAGLVGVVQSFGDAWTSQVPVLGDFFNVTADNPDWADEYTAGEAKFVDEPAVAGFQHLQDIHDAGVLNEDFASATYDDAVRMLAEGEAAHYPMLTGNVAEALGANYPDADASIGVFPIPGADSASNGLTVWMPNGVYVPKTTEGEQLEATKEFLTWLATPESCAIQADSTTLGGPFVVAGCELPDNAPALVHDMQAYFDEGRTSLALEFLSAIKGPSLEQITVEVGSGIRSADDGAALYDQDVVKQAQQLGLDW